MPPLQALSHSCSGPPSRGNTCGGSSTSAIMASLAVAMYLLLLVLVLMVRFGCPDTSSFKIDWPVLFGLLLTLAGLFAIYIAMRVVARANRSEATVGLFTFVMVGFVLLTIIGVFFRGANMALVF